ncbi:MAG: hypothetical protein IKO93_22365 [Lentisphaeria bacterium]|nr:hypothetical protein [Lentisphaeria bacterium]
MDQEPESWEKYGFPDPTLCPPFLPLEGLKKAIIERGGSFARFPEKFQSMSGRNGYGIESTMEFIDRALKALIQNNYFLNPDKLTDFSDYQNPGADFRWNWNDLLLAGADGIEDDIIETDDPLITGYSTRGLAFGPQFPVRYLIQRYKMINLLKYRQIQTYSDNVFGRDVEDGSTASLYERYLRILPNLEPDESYGSNFLGARFDVSQYQIYVRLWVTRSCKAVFPEGISGRNRSYLIGFYQPRWYYIKELSLTGGVIDHWGWNFHTADRNGVFCTFDFSNVQPLFDGAGWLSNSYYKLAFTDYSELYNFKEEPTE